MPIAKADHSVSIVPPSRRVLGLFSAYLRWYVPRSFHALRLAHPERFPTLDAGVPTIVCLNHASWWDPLTAILLSRFLAPHAEHYAPMEAAALRHYGFMRKLGLFALDTHSSRAGASFLRSAEQVFQRPSAVLWVTPEGHFTDVRQRPAQWRPGLAALVTRRTRCVVVPLAVEYTFWDERLPEMLAMVGAPLHITDGRAANADEWHRALTAAMSRTQDELAACSMARSAAPFTTVLQGGRGIARTYDLWKRAQARWTGRPYVAEHGGLPHL